MEAARALGTHCPDGISGSVLLHTPNRSMDLRQPRFDMLNGLERDARVQDAGGPQC